MDALDLIKKQSERVELKLKISKCEIWWPTIEAHDIRQVFGQIASHLDSSNVAGTELLESCIGSESAKDAVSQKRVDKIKESLAAPQYFGCDPQCALILLRSCFSPPKIKFSLRTLHMSEVHMDVEIDGALKFILGQSKIVYCYADHF